MLRLDQVRRFVEGEEAGGTEVPFGEGDWGVAGRRAVDRLERKGEVAGDVTEPGEEDSN